MADCVTRPPSYLPPIHGPEAEQKPAPWIPDPTPRLCPRCRSWVKDPDHCPVCAACPKCGKKEIDYLFGATPKTQEAICRACGAKWDPDTNFTK
jgi:hypothetical protein